MEGVIFQKGEIEMTNANWDDTALIKAYDRAMDSYKKKLVTGHSNGSEAGQKNKKNDKKAKKKQKESTKWKEGMKCLAVFSEDGQLYEAVIVSVDMDQETCQVLYDYYENLEEQKLCDLRELTESDIRHHSTSVSMENSEAECPPVFSTKKIQRDRSCSSSSSYNNHSHKSHLEPVVPSIPPPPMPDLSLIATEKDALHGMLISWYMSGYYTGYYKGLQTAAKKKDKKAHPM